MVGDGFLIDEQGWQPLALSDVPAEIRGELETEHPNIDRLRGWLLTTYAQQSGRPIETVTGSSQELARLAHWLAFQTMRAGFDVSWRRWPQLHHLLFSTYSSKANLIAQRGCPICHGARPVDDLFPVYLLPIRISPISRQAATSQVFTAFQAAFRHHFATRTVDLGRTGYYCLALTYVLDTNRRDRDLDNLTKAVQDALARALSFDDRRIQHLDVVKLRFPSSEEYIYVRLAPSALNEHGDVVAPIVAHSWAGQESLNLDDFMPPSA
jgi:hypothetical protein